jgi:hypothetical protein
VTDFASIARLLGEHRRQPRWAVFIVAAVPFLFLGLMGAEHGALPIFFGVAGLILLHLVRPTVLGWLVVTLLNGAFALLYLFVAGSDLLALVRGRTPSVFSNPVDSIVLAALLCLLLGVGITLLRSRPLPR